MKEKQNRLSKLSVVAFVIICFCLVSVTTQGSHAYTLEASDSTGFIGIIWNYFFSTTNTANSNVESENSDPAPTPSQGERTPRPQTLSTSDSSCGKLRCKNP
jgi:hypothetical protein